LGLQVITDEADHEHELIRQNLTWPGWYSLLRTPRWYERAPATPSPEYESSDESSLICVGITTQVRVDQLVGPFPVLLGNYHPVLNPDPADRGEPLPGPTTPDDR
jgi:hypothetical protein